MAKVTKTATGVAKSAFKKPIKSFGVKDAAGNVVKKIGYGFSWEEYPTPEDMLAANDGMSLAEQLAKRNTDAKTTARQAANAKAIADAGIVEPNSENDSQVRLTEVYNGLKGGYIAKGMSAEDAHTKARAKASELLEEDWADEGDDE
jgi:hypothetical protein